MTEPTDAQLAAYLRAALRPPGHEWKEMEPLIHLAAQRLEARAEISEAFWRGWIHAIRNVDIALQCRGDDRTIRECRTEILRLAAVSANPDHAVFLPEWPSDDRLIELLSGPTGIPAALEAALSGKEG